MPKFEARCSTDRVLLVEAADEAAALEIAENTEYDQWTAVESFIAVEEVKAADADHD